MASPGGRRSASPRVLLINPPQRFFPGSRGFELYFPLGLLSLAAAVRDICQVRILDCLADDSTRRREGSVVHGTPPERIAALVSDFQPDIIGVSVPFSAQSESAVAVSRLCRRTAPEAVILFGGPDPSVRYEYFLKDGCCDYCVVGEGEGALREFIGRFKDGRPLEGVAGVASFDGQAALHTPRTHAALDELPLPAYDLIDVEGYLGRGDLYAGRSRIGRASMSMVTSRGCPHRCVFCSIQLHMGREFRGHSPEYVIRHLRHLRDHYGITDIHFEDDNISLDRNRFERILDAMIAEGLGIRWDAPNGMRLDHLNDGLLAKMQRSGCVELTIAIESADAEVRDRIIGKDLSLESLPRIAETCRRLGIRLSAFYIIGLPGETIRTMQQTIDMALSLLHSADILPYLDVATPLYGTKLHADCMAKGLIRSSLNDEDLSCAAQAAGRPLIATEDFSIQDVQDLLAGYRARLRTAWMMYAVRHPVYGAGRILDKGGAVLRRLREHCRGRGRESAAPGRAAR